MKHSNTAKYMGTAIGLDFFVQQFCDDHWIYYANMQILGEIQSEPFDNNLTPSPEHWAQWVISTIEQAKKEGKVL